MTAASTPAGRHRISIDVMALAAIVLLAVTSPAFDTDDAAFFNYLNNVAGASPLYFYTGYVHVIPQLITYALSPMPLWLQPLFYPLLSIVLAWRLYRRLARLLGRRGSPTEAAVLAMAIILVLRVVEPVLWANISNAMWLALLLATVIIIEAGIDGAAYSKWSAAGLVIAGIAFPPGTLLALLLALQAAVATTPVQRRQAALLAAIIGGVHLASAAISPEAGLNTRLMEAPWMFLAGFREHKLAALLAVMSSLTLAIALQWAWRPDRRAANAAVLAPLCVLGWGSLATYVASSRFLRYDGAIPPRYAIPVLCCGLVAASWIAMSRRNAVARARSIGLLIGAAAACGALFFYGNLRGPMETTLMKYRFVNEAARWRQGCMNGEILVFESDPASPVLFCRPRALPPGDYILSGFTPTIGTGGADDVDEDRPYVISPKPLLR